MRDESGATKLRELEVNAGKFKKALP